WGFHGASHRYIAERTAKSLKTSPSPPAPSPAAAGEGTKTPPLPKHGERGAGGEGRIISCHLGGSSSLCALANGQSVANSLGFSPQTGLPHNNRVGDFDPFALPVLMRKTGRSLEQLLGDLANRSGLEGLSGCNDLRDIEDKAAKGDARAKLAIDVFVA